MCFLVLQLYEKDDMSRYRSHVRPQNVIIKYQMCVVSYLVRLALQRSIRGDCGLWSLLLPGAEAGAVRAGALLGEDPTLREWEHWEDTDRWGE